MTLPRHWIVALILATTIGPNLLVMSGFMQIQTIIQNAFGSSSYATMWISIVANMAFAVWIPLGPVLSRQLGLRFCFRCATVMFVVTFIASSISDNTVLLGISRALEGALTGTQLMVLVPLLFVEFPAERRNRVLGILLCIMFGSVVLGAIFGTISQAYDHWRWLFGLCACLSMGALLLSGHLPKHMFPVPATAAARGAWNRFDYMGMVLLFMLGISTIWWLGNLLPHGFSSPFVFVPAGVSLCLFACLIVVERSVTHPLVDFRLVTSRRSLCGAFVAILSNLLMLVAMSGMGFAMKTVSKIPSTTLPTVYGGLVISVGLAAILAASFFDRVGAGPLFIVGSLCIALSSYRLTSLEPGVSLDQLRFQLVLFSCGVGLNFVVGLVTCALGGPLNQLPRTMTVVQFLRVFFYTIVTPVSQWYLNVHTAILAAVNGWATTKVNTITSASVTSGIQHDIASGESEQRARQIVMYLLSEELQSRAALIATHHLFVISFICSLCLLVISCLTILLGKGPTVAHRSQT